MRLLITLLSVGVAFASTLASAQQPYPSKPIRLIVPFPTGGAAELGARVFAQPLSQALGQPVVIDTRPGADGAIAAEAAMRAPADGYTLIYATSTAFSWTPSARKSLPYDPITDFTPVSLIGNFGFFLFTHPSVPAQSLPDLLSYIRANPGKLNYGTGNSFSMLSTAQLIALQKLDIVHVPYKGDNPLSVALLGGQVQMAIATPSTLAAQTKDGRLRVLATLQASRNPLLPEAPTLAEIGLPKLGVSAWGGVFGPAKMPAVIVERLSRELTLLLTRPDVRENFARLAFEARSSTPQELGALVVEQIESYRKAMREVGITPE